MADIQRGVLAELKTLVSITRLNIAANALLDTIINRIAALLRFNSAVATHWFPISGIAPEEAEENGVKVWKFGPSLGQKLGLFFMVPDDYIAGQKIELIIPFYSPSTSNAFLFKTTSYLITKDTTAVSSTTNSRASTNVALNNVSPANAHRQVTFDITSSIGQINAVAVAAGDLIRVELTRSSDVSDTDTNDVRAMPYFSVVKTYT